MSRPSAGDRAPERASAEDDGGDRAPPPQAPQGGPARTALSVGAGFGVFSRTLRYHDDLFGQLHPYAMPAAPTFRVHAIWYPGAHFSRGPASWFGLTGSFEYVLGMRSNDAQGLRYPTRSLSFGVGARLRIPIDASELGVDVSYGQQRFAVGTNQAPAGPAPAGASAYPSAAALPGVPSVDYQFVELGPHATIALSNECNVTLHGGYRFLLSTGSIGSQSWFPRSSAGGLSLGAGLGYKVVPALEIRADFEMRRYFFAFHPQPGDRWVAGGAVDQYFTGTLGIVWHVYGPG